MRISRLAVLACAAALAACSEGPFIDQPIDNKIDKPVDSVIKNGTISVCYADDAEYSGAERLARETCAAYGLESRHHYTYRYQCRLTTPHRVVFRCVHPEMVDAGGRPINPFDEREVKDWRKRTGKEVPFGVKRNPQAPLVGGEASRSPSELGAPAPAPVPVEPPPPPAAPTPSAPAVRSPAPADIPSWPQPSAPPVPPPAPIGAPGLPAPEAFTLPVGSWGDAFKDE